MSIIAYILQHVTHALFGRTQLRFTKIQIEGLTVEGTINMIRMEVGQRVTFTAEPFDRHGNPAQIEAGTAEWSAVGADVDGNPIEFTIDVDPDNELMATFESGDEKATATVTLRADGDPDVGEDAPVVATESVVIDSLNVVTMGLTAGEPEDV